MMSDVKGGIIDLEPCNSLTWDCNDRQMALSFSICKDIHQKLFPWVQGSLKFVSSSNIASRSIQYNKLSQPYTFQICWHKFSITRWLWIMGHEVPHSWKMVAKSFPTKPSKYLVLCFTSLGCSRAQWLQPQKLLVCNCKQDRNKLLCKIAQPSYFKHAVNSK